MGAKIIGRASIYYGSGKEAEQRGARLDVAAMRRGFVNLKGEPELSPLLVYCFEIIDALNPEIEKLAGKAEMNPADYINQLFARSQAKNISQADNAALK